MWMLVFGLTYRMQVTHVVRKYKNPKIFKFILFNRQCFFHFACISASLNSYDKTLTVRTRHTNGVSTYFLQQRTIEKF